MPKICVYTGNGEGKTCAAVGHVIRALGHGLRCAVIFFMKPGDSGEVKTLRNLGVETYCFGRKGFVDPKNPLEQDLELAKKGIEKALEVSKRVDLLVLDEINLVISFGLITFEEFRRVLGRMPPDLWLICTGRYAPEELIEMADLVTEMREVKHPFRLGKKAEKGFEF